MSVVAFSVPQRYAAMAIYLAVVSPPWDKKMLHITNQNVNGHESGRFRTEQVAIIIFR